MSIADFRDLEVYQRSRNLLPVVKRLCLHIENEQRDLARNLMKTACQIGPEIAEGHAKKSSINEFKRFITMAIGSSDEMTAHLEQVPLLIRDVNMKSIARLINEYRIIAKQLQVLKKNWK